MDCKLLPGTYHISSKSSERKILESKWKRHEYGFYDLRLGIVWWKESLSYERWVKIF
jgi:hypothetical protein